MVVEVGIESPDILRLLLRMQALFHLLAAHEMALALSSLVLKLSVNICLTVGLLEQVC